MLKTLQKNYRVAFLTIGYSSALDQLNEHYTIDLLLHNELIEPKDRPFLQKIKKKIRRFFSSKQDIVLWAKKRNIKEYSMQYHDQSEIAEYIRQSDIDILISSFAPILKNEILQAPKLYALNIHPSDLPAYRGGNPLLWQIIDGVKHSAVTIHKLSAELDRGDIVHKEPFEIPDGISKRKLTDFINDVVAKAAANVLDMIEKNTLGQGIEQPNSSPTAFAPTVQRELITTRINWNNLSGKSLYNLVSYMDFFPVELTENTAVSTLFPLKAHSYIDHPVTQEPGLVKHRGHWYFNSRAGSLRLKFCFTPVCFLQQYKIRRKYRNGQLKKQYI